MDVLRFKHPACAVVSVDGLQLTLKPLSPFRLEQAELAAARRIATPAPGRPVQLLLERVVQVLAAASGEPPELLRDLYPWQLVALHRAWSSAQMASWPPSVAAMHEWLRRRVNDDPGVIADGLRAYLCKQPQEYYNAPLVDLTDGQVAYWQFLRAAHAEWHVPNSKGRCPTPTAQWLKSDSNDSGQPTPSHGPGDQTST